MNFYGAAGDHRDLLTFLIAQDEFEVWEAHTTGCEPRRVTDIGLLDNEPDSFVCRILPGGAGGSVLVVEHGVGNFDSEGWGLVQVSLRGGLDGRIPPSSVSANSEKRALKWQPNYLSRLGPVAQWYWVAVTKAARRVERRIRAMAGRDRHLQAPVLPRCAELVRSGWTLTS